MALLSVLLVLIIIFFIFFSIGIYWYSRTGRCKCRRRLDGMTCLVTGGTSGIGLEIAIEFARRGARVIVACPFVQEGKDAEKKIIEQSGNGNVVYKFLDLASFKEVRKFTEDILHTEDRLDILMNNAGVGGPAKTTEDGLYLSMQVNYLSHFLLTLLLLPLLKKSGSPSAPSRIVNTSSVQHRLVKGLDFDDFATPTDKINGLFLRYSTSKLCLVLFSRELTKRMLHSNVVINNVDPGAVATSIFLRSGSFVTYFMFVVFQLFAKTPYDGAQTPLHVALNEKAGQSSGQFYVDCKSCESSKISYDEELAKMLWNKSLQLVNLGDKEVQNLLK